jgi:UDP-glucose 4-epimerase
VKKVLVTGAAGFIGSSQVDFLLNKGLTVVGVDNLSTGNLNNLQSALENPNFNFVQLDLVQDQIPNEVLKGVDTVYHFSANADIRFGIQNPTRDFEQNTLCTQKLLETMRVNGIARIIFSSTGSVYGEQRIFPTVEDAPFPIQTSLYAASKVACESLIQAYSETFGMQVFIFRFVSILGPRYSHGHVIDFYRQLTTNKNFLEVLGDGNQTKSYLHVSDCLTGIDTVVNNPFGKVNIVNLGTNEATTVRDSIKWITEHMKLNPEISYGTDSQGWIGDNRKIFLDTSRITKLGWSPRFTIKQAILETIEYLELQSD